jgi:hypothetical protein
MGIMPRIHPLGQENQQFSADLAKGSGAKTPFYVVLICLINHGGDVGRSRRFYHHHGVFAAEIYFQQKLECDITTQVCKFKPILKKALILKKVHVLL